jgi:hypothetical protein
VPPPSLALRGGSQKTISKRTPAASRVRRRIVPIGREIGRQFRTYCQRTAQTARRLAQHDFIAAAEDFDLWSRETKRLRQPHRLAVAGLENFGNGHSRRAARKSYIRRRIDGRVGRRASAGNDPYATSRASTSSGVIRTSAS